MAKITAVSKVSEPTEGMCIEVDHDTRLFASGGDDGLAVVSHNSVLQRTITVSCIMRPDDWAFCGIDLKRVELSAFRKYSNVVLGIATTLEDALTILRFSQQTMMRRYTEMEQLQVNHFHKLPQKGRSLLIMVDEAGELLSPSGIKALTANTLVHMADGSSKRIEDLQVGDEVVDPNMKVCEVVDKYIPERQARFSMRFRKDEKTQRIIAGAEHNWPCRLFTSDGKPIGGERKLNSQELFELMSINQSKPDDERISIRLYVDD